MKVTTLLFFLALMQVTASSYSQQTKLNLKFQNETLESVFSKIEANSEFSIFYKNEMIQNSKDVTAEFKNASIFDILDQVLNAENMTYTVRNKLIMIVPKTDGGIENNSQQQKSVSGKVTDSSGEALPGVSVVVKGTTNGSITDNNGNYSLSNISENATLQFSFVGMKMQEVSVSGKATIDVSLMEDAIGIEEVVAIGYGVQKKSDVTGALTSVSSEEINARPVKNAVEAMQGRAAGVDITSNERPGAVGSITIRGVRSLTASNSPLYVVDGIPLVTGTVDASNVSSNKVTLGGIDNLNPNDIESIDILKDASATAIYGSRGANGVVLITTKAGKSGKFTLNFDSSVTSENMHEYSPLFNAGDYVDYRRWAKYYSNTSTFPRGDQPTQANDAAIFTGDVTATNNINKGWANGTWDGSKLTTT
ncbi:MAG: TonB-dependent receptor plug domain-containing protein, partial [Bacteroidota bacterium]|nr:TonB-dependent receptor plug domain-containing protein [Bacteroidota bacterium]